MLVYFFSVFSEFTLKKSVKCFMSRLTRLFKFFTDLFLWKDLYHQQSDGLYSVQLPYEDHWCKLRRQIVLKRNLVVHHNLLVLNRNYNHWWKPVIWNRLNHSLHNTRHGFHNNLTYIIGLYDQQYQMPFACLEI